MSKVTNKDIAERAGVSPAAVSMAIHGRRGISEQTRAHILQIVQEMNYAPPAHGGIQSERDCILLVGSTLAQQLTEPFLAALLECADRQNAELRFLTTTQLAAQMPLVPEHCILLITFDELERKTLDALTPLVPKILVIDGVYSRQPLYNIRTDYAGAANTLTRYLTSLGHRNIAYINQHLPAAKNLQAFSGFQRVILEMRLPLNPMQIVMDAADPHVWSHLQEIVQVNNISAVVCTSDQAAVTVVNLLRQIGLRVPEDVSVAALTADDTVSHPGFAFTRISLNSAAAAKMLPTLFIRSKAPERRDILIPFSSVIPGNSTASPSFDPTVKKLAIALILKEYPTYRVVRAGFLNMVQQLGYQAEVVGIADTDEEAFRKVCLSLKGSGVEGVVMWSPIPDVIRELSKSGIAVVCPHVIPQGGAELGLRANIAADPLRSAENVAAYFAERFSGQSGTIAISQTEDTEQENAVTREFIRLLHESCPQLVVRNDLTFVEHNARNVELLRRYIENTPDLLGAFTTAGEACITWAAAKKAAGRPDMVIVGTDYTEATLALIETGEVDAFLAQPLYEETQMSVTALDTILRGHEFPYFTALDAPLVTKQNAEPYVRLLQEVNNWYV